MSDYLWDKSGSDPEIEAFEASLSGLAYDRPAPAFPGAKAGAEAVRRNGVLDSEERSGALAKPQRPREDDYLWEKSGRDPQIESIEASLSGLAYDGDPPVLPLRRVPTPSPPLRAVARPVFSRGAPWTHAKAMPLAFAAGLMLMGFGVSYSALMKEKADVRRGWNLVPVLVAS